MCLAWERKGGKERAGLGCEEQRRQQQQSNEATKGPTVGRSTLKKNLFLILSNQGFKSYQISNFTTSKSRHQPHHRKLIRSDLVFFVQERDRSVVVRTRRRAQHEYGILLYGTLPAAAPKAPPGCRLFFFPSFFPFPSSRFPHTSGRLEREVVLYSHCTVLHCAAPHRTAPYYTYRYSPLITRAPVLHFTSSSSSSSSSTQTATAIPSHRCAPTPIHTQLPSPKP